jgi:hypothetical protein
MALQRTLAPTSSSPAARPHQAERRSRSTAPIRYWTIRDRPDSGEGLVRSGKEVALTRLGAPTVDQRSIHRITIGNVQGRAAGVGPAGNAPSNQARTGSDQRASASAGFDSPRPWPWPSDWVECIPAVPSFHEFPASVSGRTHYTSVGAICLSLAKWADRTIDGGGGPAATMREAAVSNKIESGDDSSHENIENPIPFH